MICNRMTNHCTAEKVHEKKRQKTLTNQQQANRLKFVFTKKQTCDPLTENQLSDKKFHVKTYSFFCLS